MRDHVTSVNSGTARTLWHCAYRGCVGCVQSAWSMWSVRSSSFYFVSSNVESRESALWVSEKRAQGFYWTGVTGVAPHRTRHGTNSWPHVSDSRGLGGHGGRRVERPAGSGPQTTTGSTRHKACWCRLHPPNFTRSQEVATSVSRRSSMRTHIAASALSHASSSRAHR